MNLIASLQGLVSNGPCVHLFLLLVVCNFCLRCVVRANQPHSCPLITRIVQSVHNTADIVFLLSFFSLSSRLSRQSALSLFTFVERSFIFSGSINFSPAHQTCWSSQLDSTLVTSDNVRSQSSCQINSNRVKCLKDQK